MAASSGGGPPGTACSSGGGPAAASAGGCEASALIAAAKRVLPGSMFQCRCRLIDPPDLRRCGHSAAARSHGPTRSCLRASLTLRDSISACRSCTARFPEGAVRVPAALPRWARVEEQARGELKHHCSRRITVGSIASCATAPNTPLPRQACLVEAFQPFLACCHASGEAAHRMHAIAVSLGAPLGAVWQRSSAGRAPARRGRPPSRAGGVRYYNS